MKSVFAEPSKDDRRWLERHLGRSYRISDRSRARDRNVAFRRLAD
jgi:hypothetical protein